MFQLLHHIKDTMLPFMCSVQNHRRHQNVGRTTVTHSAITLSATLFLLPHLDITCDLLLDRHTTTWNPFVMVVIVLEVVTGPGYDM